MRITGFILVCLSISYTMGISSYLNENDLAHLKHVLAGGLSSDDIGTVDHAVRGLAVLGVDVDNKDQLCRKLNAKLDDQKVEMLFHAGKASRVLGCQLQLPTGIKEKLDSSINATPGSVSELFFATGALSSLGYGIDAPSVLKALNSALKKDDSIASLGQAFHIAASLDGDVSSIFSRIEDVIVQADQVDGRMLQFEGGLSVTALVISGAYHLAKTADRVPPITKDQANKLAEYFVSRKSVQTVKGAHSLLEVASIFADNAFHIPVAITLASKAAVSKSEPKFQVKVTDIMGKPLKSLNVVADSATRILDDAVVLSQKQLILKDDTFELDLMSTNPGKGVYRVALSASASDDSRLVGNIGSFVQVKVLTKINIEDAEIGTADSDQSTAAKLKKVSHPRKLDDVLEADSHQKIIFKFVLRDSQTKELVTVHQAFIRLVHKESQQEIFFVAEPDVNDVYKFDLDLAAKAKDFLYLSGQYSMDLIVGDAVIENPSVWQVADIQLSFSSSPTVQPKKAQFANMYRAKPEIKHLFREPEPRPSAIVSSVCTVVLILPLVIFVFSALKLDGNYINLVLFLQHHVLIGLSLPDRFAIFRSFLRLLNIITVCNLMIAIFKLTTLQAGRVLTHLELANLKASFV
nr:EOG090X04WQ [Ilyocryptus agilis]